MSSARSTARATRATPQPAFHGSSATAFYVRPGIGLAVHTGSSANFDNRFNDKIEFGSRILFEPELGVGARINDRMTIEASWVHLSHATFLGGQNPGIDNIGARLNWKL